MRRSAILPVTALAGLSLLLSACSTTAGGQQEGTGAIEVVTSTNVYGDIVREIGGDKVNVKALISKASQDPHSYEATTQDKLAVSKAKLVVENGGGYDDFIHKLADDSNLDHDSVISAVEVSGLAPEEEPAGASTAAADEHGHSDHGEFNEHVWYSFDAMTKLADAVEAKLAALEPASASTFQANAAAFKQEISGLNAQVTGLSATSAQAPVAVTEPVPLYLLEAAGLVNKTPEDYTAAIEEGSDVPPAALKEATELAGSKDIRFLAYNTQTEGPQTQALKEAAEAAGVPVLDFSETLPDGKTYVQWMSGNVDSIKQALGK
ncbi:metal ABC transporter solute-binding protein, Zn/Mn family [Arthrobacter oryzae]|uniref:metal ABC transporter solute-binding protein, Zn/Mn family n=1 Tax=Arthrobacter oryzae TaxID=409290 RepID=UPI00285C1659|nr:zinc ABC transporter substrate-binding protein [Arthrobacter oryzae]MDR6506513.1 zinc/manganese transport system substrate-binding protein [Arthrobacter oryzae]